MRSFLRHECNDRNYPLCLALILGEARIKRSLSRVESITFWSSDNLRADIYLIISDLYLKIIGMSLDVMGLIWVCVGAAFRCKD